MDLNTSSEVALSIAVDVRRRPLLSKGRKGLLLGFSGSDTAPSPSDLVSSMVDDVRCSIGDLELNVNEGPNASIAVGTLMKIRELIASATSAMAHATFFIVGRSIVEVSWEG